MIDRFEKSGNKIYLISLPERNCYKSWINEYEIKLFKKIAINTGYTVHDFGVYSDSFFYDSHHLNEQGSFLFTKMFIDSFINKLSLKKRKT